MGKRFLYILLVWICCTSAVLAQSNNDDPFDWDNKKKAPATNKKDPAATDSEENETPSEPGKDPSEKWFDIVPPPRVVYFTFISQPINKFEDNSREELGFNEFNFGFLPKFKLGEGTYLGVGVKYQGFNVRFDLSSGTTTRSFHILSFPISLSYTSKRWLLHAAVEPGIHSDFHAVTNRHIKVQGSGLVGYRLTKDFMFLLGAAVSDDFGDLQGIPLLGFFLQPHKKFRVDILAPVHAKFAYYPTPPSHVFLWFGADGGQIRAELRRVGTSDEDDVQFSFIRLGIGGSHEFTTGMTMEAIVGYNTKTRLKFNANPTLDDRFNTDPGVFFMIRFVINGDFFNK